MEKQYFIRKQLDNKPQNKIDEMLHEAFQKYNLHTISDDHLDVFEHEHEFTVNKYQMAGGRAAVPKYYRYKPGYGSESSLIIISPSLHLILDPIKGTVTP